jgi:probable phosphoglycerate mutase
VAVSHSDVIKAALAFVLGLSIDHHDRLEIDPGSISIIQTGDWGLKVLRINEVPA